MGPFFSGYEAIYNTCRQFQNLRIYAFSNQ